MKTENFFAILMIAGLLTGCSNEDDSMGTIADPDANYFVSVDPNNNLLLRVDREDGIVVSFYGEKNELGRAVSYDYTVIEQSGEDPVFLSRVSGATRAFSPAGSYEVNQFEWSTNFSLKFNNGKTNLILGADELETTSMAPSGASPGKEAGELNVHRLQDLPECLEDNLLVRIESCTETREHLLAVLLKPLELENGSTLVGQPVGEGQFCFYVPRSPQIDLASMCLSIEMVLRDVCKQERPASNLCERFDDLAIQGGMAAFEGCELLYNTQEIACETLRAAVGEAGEDVLNSTCKAKVLEGELQAFPEVFLVEPILIFKGGKTRVLDPVELSAPYDVLVLELPQGPALADITIDPGFFEDPKISFFLECVENPTTATIRMESIDGYSYTEEKEVAAGNSVMVFNVPPRESTGNTVTVTIEVEGMEPSSVLLED